MFNKAGVIQNENAGGFVQPLAHAPLQIGNDGLVGPWRLSQEALQAARRGTRNALSQVFGVAAVGLLDQQPAQVLLTVLPRFRAPKPGRKFLMKLGERCRHPLELDLIDVSTSTTAQPLDWRLLYQRDLSLQY